MPGVIFFAAESAWVLKSGVGCDFVFAQFVIGRETLIALETRESSEIRLPPHFSKIVVVADVALAGF